MSHDLLLTESERTIFDGLSEKLKEGWTVKTVKIHVFETSDELYMRYKIAHFTDPVCVALAKNAQNAKSAQEFEKIASSIDLSRVSQEQLAELFFVLGVRVMSAMISYLLAHATTDEDLEGIAVLTNVRQMLQESNSLS